MIRYQELRTGDYVMADNDGDMLRGEITRLNGDEKQVEVDTGTQCFWFETSQLFPLPVTEEELLRLKFNKHVNEDGTLKYMNNNNHPIQLHQRGGFHNECHIENLSFWFL
jgi:hypothetical protein